MSEPPGSLCPRCGTRLLQDQETREWVCAYCGFTSNVRPSDSPRSYRPGGLDLAKRLQLLNRIAEQFGPEKVEAILKDDPELKQARDLQLLKDVSQEFG